MQLLIVRHGQCLGQCEPYDPSADSDLSALGEQQARLTAQRLAGNVWALTEREAAERQDQQADLTSGNVKPLRILSSPLIRALGTASIIADMLGGLPIEVRTELRELYALTHQGFGRADLRHRFPQAILPADITDTGWAHGDTSLEAALCRCQQMIDLLTDAFHVDDQIIMVTHGGFAAVLLQTLLRIPPSAPAWFAMDNCAITRLRIVPSQERRGWPPLFPPIGVEVVYMNDSSHLQQCSE